MKLLRVDLDAPTLAKLAAAVAAATQHNAPFADADVEQQLELWMEGLAAGDEVRGVCLVPRRLSNLACVAAGGQWSGAWE
jgi:hypothetical protein